MKLRQPFEGDYPITLDFGETWEDVYTADNPHKGIDYGCPLGTGILAAADGTVMKVGYEANGYGNYVIIQHEGTYGTVYAHLRGTTAVIYDKVKAGETIGYSGSTGNSSGPHLHFEARTQWDKIKTVFDPKLIMQNVIDTPSNTERKTVDLPNEAVEAEVVCGIANIRSAECRQNVIAYAYSGERYKLCEGVLILNGLRYRRIQPQTVDDIGGLIAEYDSEGTQILKEVTNGEEKS